MDAVNLQAVEKLPICAHKSEKCSMCTNRCGSPLRNTPPQKSQKNGHLVEDLNSHETEPPLPQPAEDVPKLCFEKTSPLWTEIESMDIFGKMGQNPHFNDLASERASLREGKAIGSMVTFMEVAKNASNFSVDAPKSRIKDDLEVLMDLEKSGFDVQILRERLTQMLLLKEEEEMHYNHQNDN